MEKAAPQSDREADDNVVHLLKLRVPVVVKLAGKKMSLEALSAMTAGTIIEFDKHSEEELELMIRDKPIGYGIAVKVGECFGLRINSVCGLRQSIAAMGEEA